VKNSEIEISRCRAAIDVASSRLTPVGRAGDAGFDFDFDFGWGFGLSLGAAVNERAGGPASKRPGCAERADTRGFLGMRAAIVATRVEEPGEDIADSADDADGGRTTIGRSDAAPRPASSLRRGKGAAGSQTPGRRRRERDPRIRWMFRPPGGGRGSFEEAAPATVCSSL
jgi:hypothetical protein